MDKSLVLEEESAQMSMERDSKKLTYLILTSLFPNLCWCRCYCYSEQSNQACSFYLFCYYQNVKTFKWIYNENHLDWNSQQQKKTNIPPHNYLCLLFWESWLYIGNYWVTRSLIAGLMSGIRWNGLSPAWGTLLICSLNSCSDIWNL